MSKNEETFKKIVGPTPAGGIYVHIYFFNENGPTTKDKATEMHVVEYDKDDKELRRVKLTKRDSNWQLNTIMLYLPCNEGEK